MTTTEKYSFALCIDPETQKYYSINLQTQAIHIQQFSQDGARRQFADKAHQACNQLKQILSWQTFDYGITKQVDFYRRRKLPDYLLQVPKLKIPSHILQQPLQRSITFDTIFDEKGEKKQIQRLEIDAEIYLVEYVDVIRSKQLFVMQPQRTLPKVFTCKLRLPNPVNEVIKVIIKMAFQKQQIELTTRKPEHQFVLKVFGSESYLYGNTTFVKYEYVRRCLRNKETARFQLTQKKFKQRSRFRGIVFERLKKDVDQGIYKQLRWFTLRAQEPFLWYPPTKINEDFLNQLKEQSQISRKYLTIKAKIKDRQKEDFSYKTPEMDRLREQLDEYGSRERDEMPHFVLKQFMMKKTEERNLEAYNKIFQIDNKMIYSGECQFSIDIKAVCIIRFNNVLKHKNNPKSFSETKFSSLSIYFKFTYGNQILEWKKLSPIVITNNISLDYSIEWNKLSCLPFESKLIIQLIAFQKDIKDGIHVGTASFNLFNEKGYLLTGTQKTNIWPFLKPDLRTAGAIGCYRGGFNLEDKHYSQIILEFPKFIKKVRWSLRNSQILYNFGYNKIDVSEASVNPKVQQIQTVKSLLSYNPMKMIEYDEKQKRILKLCYQYYSNNSQKYINYLYCINWLNPRDVQKAVNAREMLNKQKEEIVKSSHYIGVFSSRFVDEAVRLNAVEKLISATDDEIVLYIPQLVQALLSETVHQNALSEFLLERAILSPYSIGQALFWELKNQLHKSFQFQRFAIYLQCLVMSSVLRSSFVSQLKFHDQFQKLSDRISFSNQKGLKSKTRYLRTKQIPQLRKRLPIPFIFPLTPQKQNDDFTDLQCTVLTSKKKSYILTLVENPGRKKKRMPGEIPKTEPKIITLQKVIFKSGSDIRLQQLILQMMKLMDNIWLQKMSLDLKMCIYKIITISDMTGYIEVMGDFESWVNVLNTREEKEEEMNMKERYDKYLLSNNPKHQDYLRSIDNFVKSTAGFFVASYLLGLYDNFDGYDLLTKNGIFVHIGYSNFLGSHSSQLPQEIQPQPTNPLSPPPFPPSHSKSPFQSTASLKHLIDKHKMWQQFAKFCSDAYQQVRKNANYIIQMLMIMVSAGISNLYDESNVGYLVKGLSLELGKIEAEKKMRREIEVVFGVELRKEKEKEVGENLLNLIPVPIVPIDPNVPTVSNPQDVPMVPNPQNTSNVPSTFSAPGTTVQNQPPKQP